MYYGFVTLTQLAEHDLKLTRDLYYLCLLTCVPVTLVHEKLRSYLQTNVSRSLSSL